MKIILRKEGNSLWPCGPDSQLTLERLPRGKELVAEIKSRGRNAEFLSRYWSVLSLAVDHSDEWDDRDDVDHWVRVQIPWMRKSYVVEEDGTCVVTLRSIAVDAMDEDEFDKFYERAMQLISAKVGCDIEELAEAVWERQREGRRRCSTG